MSQRKPRAAVLLKQARNLVGRNRLEQARAQYLEICRQSPDNRAAWLELSELSRRLGNLEEAERAASRVLATSPEDGMALHALGAALHRQRRLDAAVGYYRRALRFSPDQAETRYFLANALRELGEMDEAETEYFRTIELAPEHVPALNNLSALLTNRGRLGQATALLERALRVDPDSPQMQVNLGRLLLHAGDAAAAAATFRKVLAVRPGLADVHSNLLACLNYLPDQDPAAVLAAHRGWEAAHTDGLHVFNRWHVDRGPRPCLRIGYVSPDLCEHSVARFLEPVLAAHDPERCEVFCYSDVAHPDEVTRRLRSRCAHWCDAHGLSHEQLASRIREDRIDILVDLAGHTARNRLLVFAMKPAPVQVTWLGYPNTTGLAAMDYRLTDARADPVGMTEACHSETLLRLPDTFLCYRGPDDAPAVSALPAGANGPVTFASFNNLAKTTPRVIEVWSRILLAVPGSRLLLKSRATGDVDVRDRLVAGFAARGVDQDRLAFHPPVPDFRRHLEVYHQVDIALDTFPYNGTTTTCEALWMGVPVIGLAGGVHAARVGASLLAQVGLEDLVAMDESAYVEAAKGLASDRGRLVALRAGLRDKLRNSTLCDADRFTRELERLYTSIRETWRNSQ